MIKGGLRQHDDFIIFREILNTSFHFSFDFRMNDHLFGASEPLSSLTLERFFGNLLRDAIENHR